MIILSLDTTLSACSAAIYDTGGRGLLASEQVLMDKGHAEAIAPMVQRCLAEAGLQATAIGRIAVTSGPGTFTGLRIGLALAHGMGTALACDVVGIDSLTATAAPLLGSMEHLLVVHQAGATGRVYAGRFEAGQLRGELMYLAPGELIEKIGPGPIPLIGTGADTLFSLAPGRFLRVTGHDRPRAAAFAQMAADIPSTGEFPQPVYLREPDAKPQAPFAAETIRLAVAADIQSLSRLHMICFDEGWDEESLRSTLSMPGVVALLAERDGAVRAFMVVRSVADEAEVLTLCTAPHWRRRALAQRLLAAARDLLRTQNISHLHLEVAADNDAARALYAAQGFSETGRRKGYYARASGPACDAILMACSP